MKTTHAVSFRRPTRDAGLAIVLAGLSACAPVASEPDAQPGTDAQAAADVPGPLASDVQSDAGAADATDATASDAALANDAAAARSVTFTPAAIPADAAELPNALRGQYLWLGHAAAPAGWTDNDSYVRWDWQAFEPSHHNYNWGLIDAQLAAARARHGRFGMRLIPLCMNCGSHTFMGATSSIPDDVAMTSNSFIGSPAGSTTRYVIPDWNSETYLTRVEEVVAAIGAHYHDDPTLAWMDVSSYGNWGEFHLYPFDRPGGAYDHSTQRPITDANARRIVRANAAAFANKLLVLNATNVAALTEAIATSSPPVGFRVDCLGSDGLSGAQNVLTATPGALEHWRVAPFITEWCEVNQGSSGMNLFVQGAAQVDQFHVSMLSSGNYSANPTGADQVAAFRTATVHAGYRLRASTATVRLDPATPGAVGVALHWVDDNVAPTYLHWRVVFGLRSATAHAEQALTVDLRTVLPDAPQDDTETVHIASLPSGTYTAYVRVEDVQGVSAPMFLAMEGRDGAGNYVLGDVAVP